MIAPRNEFAGSVEATLEEMKPGGAVVVVVKIVFARPKEFDRNADSLGDGGGFEHIVVGEATAEPAAGALQMDDDVVVGNVEDSCDELSARFGRLAGRPEFHFAVVVMRKAVFRLHGGVSEKGIGVCSLDSFCGRLQSFFRVAVAADGDSRRLFRK